MSNDTDKQEPITTEMEAAGNSPAPKGKDDDFMRAIMGSDFDKTAKKKSKEENNNTRNEEKKEEKRDKEKIKGGRTKDNDNDDNKGKKSKHELTLEEAIVNSSEDEEPMSATFTLRKILGGDILTADFVRRQIGVILLIVVFLFIYISNRYSVQKDLIELDRLQTELQNAKYKALSATSLVTEKSRESHILEMLKTNKDSMLKQPTKPPYIINVPE